MMKPNYSMFNSKELKWVVMITKSLTVTSIDGLKRYLTFLLNDPGFLRLEYPSDTYRGMSQLKIPTRTL